MIYYLTPFCSDKRLGHIHNEYCKLIPEQSDWIAICDPDMLFLAPETQSRIEYIIQSKGGKFDVLGCVTNRVGVPAQVSEFMSNANDIETHISNCEKHWNKYGDEIQETDIVAGFLMIFKKSLWDRIKFEECISFDKKFCKAVRDSGGRIGIMKGIYVLHIYRMWANTENPKSYKKHLKK